MADDSRAEKFHFGDWLRRLIETQGVPLKTFAARVPCSQATLQTWLNSVAPEVRGFNRGRLAKALGVEKDSVDAALAAAARGDRLDTATHWFDRGMASASEMVKKLDEMRAKRRVGIDELWEKLDEIIRQIAEHEGGVEVVVEAIVSKYGSPRRRGTRNANEYKGPAAYQFNKEFPAKTKPKK